MHHHVHGDGQVDELGGLAERLGDGRYGREVDIRRERADGSKERIRVRAMSCVGAKRISVVDTTSPEHGCKRGHCEDEPLLSGGIDAI